MNNPYAAPTVELQPQEPPVPPTSASDMIQLSGRIGRVRYVLYSITLNLVVLVLMFVSGTLGGHPHDGPPPSAAIGGVIGIVLARRRLQDLGRSGWYAALMLLPFANLGLILMLLLAPGAPEANAYGAPPAPNPRTTVAMAWVMGALMVAVISGLVALAGH